MDYETLKNMTIKERTKYMWSTYSTLQKASLIVVIVFLSISFPLALKDKQDSYSSSSMVDTIWNAYITQPGNVDPEFRYTDVHGKLIKKGSVSPDRMNTSVKERLPAYLACYDFVQISSLGDSQYHLCMYYVDNPSRNIHYLMWRGGEFMHQLEDDMALDDFRSN